jgi:hypothetical protein
VGPSRNSATSNEDYQAELGRIFTAIESRERGHLAREFQRAASILLADTLGQF